MNATKNHNLGMLYFLVVLAIILTGFYALKHFIPDSGNGLSAAKIGDLKLTAQLLWFAIGFFFLFRFVPSTIRWNAYFWGGILIIIAALIVMMNSVPELKFINFTGLSLNPIEGCVIIFIGVFFMFKGYLAYE